MIDLTPEQLAAAKAGELDAVTAVIKATEERVIQLARRYATINGHVNADLAEELAQIGRIAVWRCLERYVEPYDVAMFFSYMDHTVSGTLSDARRSEQRPGVSQQAAKDFETAYRLAGGDPYEAQRLASTDAMGTRKMSPELAYAARLSWQGVDYLDAPVYDDDGGDTSTFAASVADKYGVNADLVEPSDIERVRRAETRERVHATLGRMGGQQRDILKGTFGISPAPLFGTENDDELAAYAGVARTQVRANRSKAKDRFRDLYPQGDQA